MNNKEYMRNYYLKNREKLINYSKNYYKKYKDEIKFHSKVYKLNNKDKINKYRRDYYKKKGHIYQTLYYFSVVKPKRKLKRKLKNEKSTKF